MTNDIFVTSGWHWQFGWMRRRRYDDANGYCYEHPDGSLIFTSNPRFKKALRLSCWEDAETGERYLAINHAPCKTHRFAR